MRVLVVEDQIDLNAVLCDAVREAGYEADGATDGAEASKRAAGNVYDLIILDLGLPDTDGLSLCRAWRSGGYPAAILILTAQGRIADRVAGLDSGADDYLVKPFHIAELLARVRALTRREQGASNRSTLFQVADLTLDATTHIVTRGERRLALTHREYCILRYMIERAGKVVTRWDLMRDVWERTDHEESNLIDVYMGRLRHHVDGDAERPLLETIRGVGYRIAGTRS